MMRRTHLLRLAALLGVALLAGCSITGSGSSDLPPVGTYADADYNNAWDRADGSFDHKFGAEPIRSR